MSKKRGAEADLAAEEDMIRLAVKHAGLKQDYNELQRETRALKKRMQRAKLKKDNLIAEVRFLRRRHRFLTKKPLEAQVNEALTHNQSPAVSPVIGSEFNNVIHPKQPLCAKPMAAKQPLCAKPTAAKYEEDATYQEIRSQLYTTSNFDHSYENKHSVAREFQVFWEPLRMSDREQAPSHFETSKRKPVHENGGLVADLNLSIFKDIPNGFVLPNRAGKPKISWQDQMALRV